MKSPSGPWLPDFPSRGQEDLPLYVGIYRTLREAILSGGLPPGRRLPSSRTLAQDLGVSRTTAEEALAKLEGEGFVVRRTGSGSYVSERLPDAFAVPKAQPRPRRPELGGPRLSARGQTLLGIRGSVDSPSIRAFAAGQPAPDAFPFDLWHKLLVRRSRAEGPSLLGYGEAQGYLPLRQAISEYLTASRGVICVPDQVIVLSSTQQALDLTAKLVIDPGDQAWIEDPGYPGAKATLLSAGADLVPIPVDDHGLDVALAIAQAPNARLAYLTPNHQYPMGPALSLERRLMVLAWARRRGAWIIEDDYDSEFRYEGRPLAALQGLEAEAPVVYVGTFTKPMFPSLRLAYAVAPPNLVKALTHARTLQDGHPALLSQAVMTDFLNEGHFHTHLRRMKALYQGRREVLMEAMAPLREYGLRVGEGGGLHLTVHLEEGSDQVVSRRAAQTGLILQPLSTLSLRPDPPQGFVLGYAALEPRRIQEGIARLRGLLQGKSRTRR